MDTVRVVNLSFQLCGSVFLIIIMACLVLLGKKQMKSEKYFLYLVGANVCNMLMDALAFCFRGRPGMVNRVGVYTSNFLQFAFAIIEVVIFMLYQQSYISEKTGKPAKKIYLKITNVISVASLTLLIINQVYPFLYVIDNDNFYQRLPLYPLICIHAMTAFLLSSSMMIQYRRSLSIAEKTMVSIYILIPLASVVLTSMFYGLAVGQMGTTVALIAMLVFLQSEQGKRMALQEKELAQSRIDTMISQIQPHFLYNTLSSISVLCRQNPALAAQATDSFTGYLRGNLDNLKRQEPVTLKEELKYVENYVWLEKLRFGDDLEVSYQIDDVELYLPAMSIQPLVENAVKHGMMGKEGVCHIVVATHVGEQYVDIIVTDDGAGFDTNEQLKNERSHIGLENVQKRLEYLMEGTLSVESEKGRGTKVILHIPKGYIVTN